jgi:hypothetical protein
MADESPKAEAGAAVNEADGQAAEAPINVDEHYGGIKPLKWLGLKLLLVTIAVAGLLTIAAAIRQKYFELPPSPLLVASPIRDLPAYHQIQSSDLDASVRLVDQTEAKTVTNTEDLVGRYTLEALPKGKAIAESQLGPIVTALQFSSKTVIEMTASKPAVENAKLKAGDVIDVILNAPPQAGQSGAASNVAFENILLLNVKPMENSSVPGEDYLLTLAVPLERHAEFVTANAKRTSFVVQKKTLTN